MSDTDRLLRVRRQIKEKRPKFRRQESWRYTRLKASWRKPKGLDNKVRTRRKGFITMPDIGHRSPKKVRNYHPSGKIEALVENIEKLEKYNPETDLIRISGKLGLFKKLALFEKAEELGFKVINKPILEERESEKWGKLYDLEKEKIEPEVDEGYVKELEKEGALEGLPEFDIEEDTSKKPTIKKKPKAKVEEKTKAKSPPKQKAKKKTSQKTKGTTKKTKKEDKTK